MKFNLSKLLLVLVVLFTLCMVGLSYYDVYRSVRTNEGETAEHSEETATEI